MHLYLYLHQDTLFVILRDFFLIFSTVCLELAGTIGSDLFLNLVLKLD